MSTEPDRRSRKRLALRRTISDAATRLFFERGFDRVTVDEIADAADVGRMTVFNHFPRKEDLFFDRADEGREDLREALRQRRPGERLSETLRLFAHRAVAEERPYIRFFPASRRFVVTIGESETLKARARAIRDELAEFAASTMAETVGTNRADPDAVLAANMVLAAWATAFVQAHGAYRDTADARLAQGVFLTMIDRAAAGMAAALAGTPYD